MTSFLKLLPNGEFRLGTIERECELIIFYSSFLYEEWEIVYRNVETYLCELYTFTSQYGIKYLRR